MIEVYNERESYYKENLIRPDTTLVIKCKDRYFLYFIEMERSWSTDKKIKDKLKRYDILLRKKSFSFFTHQPVLAARVLFVSGGRISIQPLINKIVAAAPTIDVLVGKLAEVCADPLGRVFYADDSENRFSIVGKIKTNN